MFQLATRYAHSGMSAYVELQEQEFALAAGGYSATTHQRFVGTGYFDAIQTTVASGHSSTEALAGSTETEQFARTAVKGVPGLCRDEAGATEHPAGG
jgi:isocitrate lyase